MRSDVNARFAMDQLESRQLLSGHPFHLGFDHHPRRPDIDVGNPVIKADLDKIKADEQKLVDDRKTLRPTLQADQKAIHDAIDALNASLQPLRQAVRDDLKAWRTVLQIDFQTIRQDRKDPTKLAADITQLKADQKSATDALKADSQAIQDAISNDTTVKAARDKLAADSKLLSDDFALIQADFDQLRKDLKDLKTA